MSKRNCKKPFNCKDCKEYCVPATVYYKKNSSKLKEIYFFYNGYNISVTKNVEEFDSFLFNYYNSYKLQHQICIKDYLKQLNLICLNYDADIYDDRTDKIFAMNVFVLTKMNVIINDDENGLVYIYI